MDGRRPTAIMYVNTDVDQPWKQDEYQRWYRDVHFPDVTEPGIFVQPEMFHNAVSPIPAGEGKFLVRNTSDNGFAGNAEMDLRDVDVRQGDRIVWVDPPGVVGHLNYGFGPSRGAPPYL